MKDLIKITLNEIKRSTLEIKDFEKLNESDREILIIEIAKDAIKRFDKFREVMHVQPQTKETFNQLVLAMLS